MQRSDEKLCLQWNDFRGNVSSAFKELRDDKDFTDLTLACEDGQQVEAHKGELISSSPFFLNILKRNKHPHPLIYMRGVKSEDLSAILDFLYSGEANVNQENLESFLAIAEELKLQGLMATNQAAETSFNNDSMDSKTPPNKGEPIRKDISSTKAAKVPWRRKVFPKQLQFLLSVAVFWKILTSK